MKEVLERLERLQEVDLRVREIEKERDEIPAKIEELLRDTRVREEELARIDQRIAEVEHERRMLEDNVKEYHEKLQKVLGVQAGVKNQREYEALLKEVDGHRKHKNHFEEEVLRSMEILEELGKTRAAAAESTEQSRKAVEAEVGELEAEMEEYNARIRTEAEQRGDLTAGIPNDVLKRYDTIRAKRLGLAVVEVRTGVCGGCNMNVPPQFYNQIMRFTSIESCPSCGRILYYRPEPQATASN